MTVETVTFGDVVRFINDNKKNRAYQGYSELMIAEELYNDTGTGCYRFALNDSGQLVGIVTFALIPVTQTLYVNQLICNEKWVLKAFISQFIETFPGWNIESTDSRGNNLKYNTDKLIRRIMKYG